MQANYPSNDRLLKLSMLPSPAPEPAALRALTGRLVKAGSVGNPAIPEAVRCPLREDKPAEFPARDALLACVPVLRDGLVVIGEEEEEAP